ncbi:class I SAM-dependent methyltransferase [Oryzobacter telluris]|uniref:class I SAM-dependent methyltransferase n=1 Tax=Oryzobacter telluris TaxID=3149179 RepID=UPI00370D3684
MTSSHDAGPTSAPDHAAHPQHGDGHSHGAARLSGDGHTHGDGHVHDDAFTSGHVVGTRPGEAEWDARYGENASGIWSGAPNHALTIEAGGLPPGRALDIGCGEGADAVWLAGQGWAVVGLDPSGVALDRARAAAEAKGVDVRWVHAELADAADDLADGAFDLVSAFYPTLFTDTNPLPTLARLVAPGGSLLVVHHADVDRDRARAHGFDPEELLSPADVAAGVGAGWTVEVDERRPRVIEGGAGAHHSDDLVVRVRRDA